MFKNIKRLNEGLNIYVEPGYITTCVPSGMKLVDFHLNKPVYEFNFNGCEMRCNSIAHAVEIMMTQILARNGMRCDINLKHPELSCALGASLYMDYI